MSKNIRPKVTIGLPVYNGENYLSEAIESILNQTFPDFELIISDNASSDRTEEICRHYKKKDNRIRYYRAKTNLGAALNYNRTFELARGEYFKWSAHDDVLEPEYLQKCVEILDSEPDFILCQTEVKIINSKGKLIEYYQNPLHKMDSYFPQNRFGDMVLSHHPCFDVFGLIRYEVLIKTKLHGNYLGADRNLLAELALRGRLYKYPDYLFNIRDHSKRSVRAGDQSPQSRAIWFDPMNRGKRMYEHPHHFIEYVKSIHRVPLSVSERAASYQKLFKWTWREKKTMMNDFINSNPYAYRAYKLYAFFKYLGRKKPVPQKMVKKSDKDIPARKKHSKVLKVH